MIVTLAACAHSAAPAPAAPLDGWWEVTDTGDAAGVFGGSALRIGAGEVTLVMPSIPAFEVCKASVSAGRVSITGCGQDTSATLAGDELEFAEGFHAHRTTTDYAATISQVRATCDRARACFHAAAKAIDVGPEDKTFGPLLRSDACTNIVTNIASDLQEAHVDVPAACTP
jgi:hypothetical protein